jgi:hypothetical protein
MVFGVSGQPESIALGVMFAVAFPMQGQLALGHQGVDVKGVSVGLGVKEGLPSHFGHFIVSLGQDLRAEDLQGIHRATSHEFRPFFDD